MMIQPLLRALAFIVFHTFLIVRVRGKQHVPARGPLVVYSNHRSNWDPILVGYAVPRQVHFMAKEQLFRNPLIGKLLSFLGAFPVKRGAADPSAVKQGLRILQAGKALIIFPEGTRNKDGNLGKLHPGAAMFAIRTQALALPVAIRGEYKLFGKIEVEILPPLDLSAFATRGNRSEVLQEAISFMMEPIRSRLEEQR